ncbi:MAG: hypothetical protein WC781_02990 [Candidatus Pacearchaeota archaeon]|jgi:hypothetical protein
MALETILTSSFAVQVVYPFLLIFTIVFAILQKSKILGEGKQQIDALAALSIALIFVAFSWATGIVTKLMPFLAVSVVVILVFLILFGFVSSTNEKGLELPKWLQYGFLVIIIIAVIIAVIVATGQWDFVYNSLFVSGEPTGWGSNIIIIAILIAAITTVVISGKKKGGS